MSNVNWVCFDCQESVRLANARCPKCGKAMVQLGKKIPIPPKRDKKAWGSLRKQIGEARRNLECRTIEDAVRRRHKLEQVIRKLEAMPSNEGRENSLSHFRKMLKEHN